MGRASNRWARQSSFVVYFAVCGAIGLGLLVWSAYAPPQGVGSAVLQGLGVALVSTATVAAPITFYGHTLFLSEFRDLTVDKLLQMRLVPELVANLRETTFDKDVFRDLRFRMSLEPVPGQVGVLNFQFRRDYRIVNDTYDARLLGIGHTQERSIRRTPGFVPGFRQVHLSVVSLDGSFATKAMSFDASECDSGRTERFLGRPITIDRGDRFVRFRLDLELPGRSYLSASIVSEARVGVSGAEPFVANRPTASMELTVVHRPETAVAVFGLHNLSGSEVERTTTAAPDQTGRIEEHWDFRQGFFPGQGVQLRWDPHDGSGRDEPGDPA